MREADSQTGNTSPPDASEATTGADGQPSSVVPPVERAIYVRFRLARQPALLVYDVTTGECLRQFKNRREFEAGRDESWIEVDPDEDEDLSYEVRKPLRITSYMRGPESTDR